jgi:hypothetical protein
MRLADLTPVIGPVTTRTPFGKVVLWYGMDKLGS